MAPNYSMGIIICVLQVVGENEMNKCDIKDYNILKLTYALQSFLT